MLYNNSDASMCMTKLMAQTKMVQLWHIVSVHDGITQSFCRYPVLVLLERSFELSLCLHLRQLLRLDNHTTLQVVVSALLRAPMPALPS